MSDCPGKVGKSAGPESPAMQGKSKSLDAVSSTYLATTCRCIPAERAAVTRVLGAILEVTVTGTCLTCEVVRACWPTGAA